MENATRRQDFSFKDWIFTTNPWEDFTRKDSLECGCGGGKHAAFNSTTLKHHTAVDLNTLTILREKEIKDKTNITYLAWSWYSKMDWKFDIVFQLV
jgi:hypothetical protein